MDLQQINKKKSQINLQIEEINNQHKLQLKSFAHEITELNKQEFMLINNLNSEKILLAENFIKVDGYKGFGDDNKVIADAIKELAENSGELFFSQYLSTKNYDRWSHQDNGWTRYGYGPKHGYVTFRIGFLDSIKGINKRSLTVEEIDAAIYYLELIKSNKYPQPAN